MEQKNIIGYSKEYEIKDHPSVEGLKIIEGKAISQLAGSISKDIANISYILST